MTLRLGMRIDGDASGASRALTTAELELRALESVAKRTGKSLEEVSERFRRARGEIAGAANDNALGRISEGAAQVARSGGLVEAAAGKIASFITPANAISVALNIATAAAGYFFGRISSDAPSAEQALQEHARLLGVVKDAFGKAAGAAGDFFKQSREITLLQAQQNVIALQANLFRQSQGTIDNVARPRVNGLTDMGGLPGDTPMAMQGGVEVNRQWQQFADTIDKFNRSVEAGTPDVVTFRDEVARIGLAARGSDPALAAQANRLLENTKAAGETAFAIRQAEASIRVMQGTATEADRKLLGLAESTRKVAAETNEFTRAQRSIRLQTERLEMEAAAYGMSATEAARYRAETTLLNAAKASGIALDPKVLEGIKAQADAYAQATARLKEQAERQQAIETLRQTTSSFLQETRRGLRQGEGLWESFSKAGINALDRLSDKLLDMATQDLFAQMFGGNSSGGLGGFQSLFGPLFGGGGLTGGGGTSRGGNDFGAEMRKWTAEFYDAMGADQIRRHEMVQQAAKQYHQGGIAGLTPAPSRMIHPMYFENAPRFHGGKPPWGPREIPAVIERDEEILTTSDPRHRWNGGGQRATVNNFYVTTPDARSFAQSRAQVARGMNRVVAQASRFS